MNVVLPILVFFAVLSLGGAVIVAVMNRRKSIEPRLRSMKGEIAMPVEQSSGVVRVISRIGESAAPTASAGGLRQYLATAGFYGNSAAATYIGIKLLLLVIGVSGSIIGLLWVELSLANEIYITAIVSVLLFFLPNLVVYARRSARRGEIRRHLPDVVDLLEICVSAGMGLDMAWNAVSDEIRNVSNVMADEMALTMLETQLGAPRTVAMRHMAERTGADELASLVALLVQSDRFGTSVAEALRTFATSMREARSQKAEEAAEKTAVKLLFPLVLCIFPVMFIVTVGPASIVLFRLIKNV